MDQLDSNQFLLTTIISAGSGTWPAGQPRAIKIDAILSVAPHANAIWSIVEIIKGNVIDTNVVIGTPFNELVSIASTRS